MTNVEELTAEYIEARRIKERLKAEKAKAEKRFAAAEQALAEHFTNTGAQSFKKGALFSLKQQFRVSFPSASVEPVKEWLEARGLEVSDYVSEKIDYTAAKSAIKKVYKDEGEFALPGGDGTLVNLNTDPAIAVTGWKEHYAEVDDEA